MEDFQKSQGLEKKIENVEKTREEKLYSNRAVRFLMVPGIATIICAYANFFGYTYLKGKLNEAGFAANYIDLNVNETIFSATLGVLHLFALLGECYIGYIYWIWGVLISVAAGLMLAGSIKKLNILRGASNYVVEFMKRAFSGYVFFTVLIVFLLLMVLGYSLGQNQMSGVIKSNVCRQLENGDFNNKSIVRGCTKTQLADGNHLSGVTIFEDSNYRYFLTNKGSYQINSEREIVASNCFYRETDLLNAKPTEFICAARCESFCQSVTAITPSDKGSGPSNTIE